jgi:hypothetical protein
VPLVARGATGAAGGAKRSGDGVAGVEVIPELFRVRRLVTVAGSALGLAVASCCTSAESVRLVRVERVRGRLVVVEVEPAASSGGGAGAGAAEPSGPSPPLVLLLPPRVRLMALQLTAPLCLAAAGADGMALRPVAHGAERLAWEPLEERRYRQHATPPASSGVLIAVLARAETGSHLRMRTVCTNNYYALQYTKRSA